MKKVDKEKTILISNLGKAVSDGYLLIFSYLFLKEKIIPDIRNMQGFKIKKISDEEYEKAFNKSKAKITTAMMKIIEFNKEQGEDVINYKDIESIMLNSLVKILIEKGLILSDIYG